MDNETIERRMDRVSFRHLAARVPVKMLALEAVAGFLTMTRKRGEERIAESCLRCYFLNALDNNYARDVKGHCGVHVFAAGKSKESGRTSTEFFTHFAEFVRPLNLDSPGYYAKCTVSTPYLTRILEVQRLKARYDRVPQRENRALV